MSEQKNPVKDIIEGDFDDRIHTPNPDECTFDVALDPNQRFYIVEIQEYIYVVPFVEDDVKVFLKTIYPSRKLTKKYLKGGK